MTDVVLKDGDNWTTYYVNVSDDVPRGSSFHPASFWNKDTFIQIAPMLLVMVTTIIGNTILIVSLMNKPTRRRKRVNVFIVNLALADLTVALITMTTELLQAVFRQWVLGAALCKLLLYSQVVTLSSTTFLLTGMSIDRYQVIVRPLQSLADRPKIKSKVAVAWVMAFVISIPQTLIFVQVEHYDERTNESKFYCKSAGYSAEWQRKFYFSFQTFYILLMPAGIMLFCYSAIVVAIWRRGGETTNTGVRSVTSPRMSMRKSTASGSRRKVVFMTLSVILAYIVCLTPYFIISLIRIYSHYSLDLKEALSISQTIFMLHSALNPILYGLFTLRAVHISSLFSCVINRQTHGKTKSNGHQRKSRKTNFDKLRTGAIFFRRRNSGETSVIIANHAAKEESSFKLRTRENGRYTSYT